MEYNQNIILEAKELGKGDINKGFRLLLKKYHPETGEIPDEDKYIEINETKDYYNENIDSFEFDNEDEIDKQENEENIDFFKEEKENIDFFKEEKENIFIIFKQIYETIINTFKKNKGK